MRITKKHSIAALSLFLVSALLPVQNAKATSDLKCLEQSRGKIITWNSQWGSDRKDRGTVYLITKVAIVNKIPNRMVTLRLEATGTARRKTRTLTVKTEERARPICKKLRNIRRPIPGISDKTPESSLPFIRYTKDGWVRANPPAQVYELSVCRVHQREFSCLSEEKERFSIMLKTTEEEIRWSGS